MAFIHCFRKSEYKEDLHSATPTYRLAERDDVFFIAARVNQSSWVFACRKTRLTGGAHWEIMARNTGLAVAALYKSAKRGIITSTKYCSYALA